MTRTHPIVARDFAGPDIAVRCSLPRRAVSDVVRGFHDELVTEMNAGAATAQRKLSANVSRSGDRFALAEALNAFGNEGIASATGDGSAGAVRH